MNPRHYRIEELIPAENAIGGKPFWTQLSHPSTGLPWRSDNFDAAEETFNEIKRKGPERTVRLVRVEEGVVQMYRPPQDEPTKIRSRKDGWG